jgi:hypothetical protein
MCVLYTEADAAPFAVDKMLKNLPAILPRTERRRAEIVTRSEPALTEIQNPCCDLASHILEDYMDAHDHVICAETRMF